jgi:hypothetical protein
MAVQIQEISTKKDKDTKTLRQSPIWMLVETEKSSICLKPISFKTAMAVLDEMFNVRFKIPRGTYDIVLAGKQISGDIRIVLTTLF